MENKNPNEQLGGVVNAWAESQKRLWGDWSQMLQNLPGGQEGLGLEREQDVANLPLDERGGGPAAPRVQDGHVPEELRDELGG